MLRKHFSEHFFNCSAIIVFSVAKLTSGSKHLPRTQLNPEHMAIFHVNTNCLVLLMQIKSAPIFGRELEQTICVFVDIVRGTLQILNNSANAASIIIGANGSNA